MALFCLLALCLTSAWGLSLSNTLGSHMVLQRAPASSVVWGFANSGVQVTTNFNGQNLMSTADSSGVWRQTLPPTVAGGPYTLMFTATDGGSASLSDVLFGDVYLCGGQSNMEFTVSLGNNASAEIATANNYPNIRVFTVGQGTASNTPLTNLGSIEQAWALSSTASVGGPDWAYQSAVCWLWGRQVYDALGGKVPLGLVSNNWGGTTIQQWSSSDAASQCGSSGSGNLWNAMIVPYITGPMALTGFTWYQGESNVGQDTFYACAFPVMIKDWRTKFNNANAWFGFIQIAGYNYGPGPTPADLRQAQLAGLQLPQVGWATAVDVGTWNDIHPKDKQTVASRLAFCTLDQVYGMPSNWEYPIYSGAQQSTSGTTITVTVSFQPSSAATGFTTVVPAPAAAAQANICVTGLDPATECGFPQIQINDSAKTFLNATARIGPDGNTLVLTATAPGTGYAAISSSYGRASWAVNTFFNAYGLPVIPWYMTL